MNKSGDLRGTKEVEAHNFANNKELASKNGKKPDTASGRLSKMISTSKAIVEYEGPKKVLKEEIRDYIETKWLEKDKYGREYYKREIDAIFRTALDTPKSAQAIRLMDLLLPSDYFEKYYKVNTFDAEYIDFKIRKSLYDKQQEVYDYIKSAEEPLLMICTRRAGKTELDARLLLADTLLHPNHHALYLNRSSNNAIRQLGTPLQTLLDNFNIEYSGSTGAGFLTLKETGSTITLSGYNNKGDIDRYRGGKYSLIILDEIGHLRNPKILLEEVLEPAQTDYGKDARLVYTGTPPRTKKSFARELYENKKITKFKWSFMDNPFIPDKENAIKKICERHGVDINNPFIRREYFGDMDALDTEALVFKDYKKCTFTLTPDTKIERAYIGVDWGFEDSAAVISTIVVNNKLYTTDVWIKPKQSISTICKEVERQYLKLSELNLENTVQVITDNNEKSAAFELSQTYKLPNVTLAYKYDKEFAIEQLAEWMRTGDVYIDKELCDEADNTVWKRDEETDEILHEIDDDIFHPNGLFALLYISRQYAYEVKGLIENNKEAKAI